MVHGEKFKKPKILLFFARFLNNVLSLPQIDLKDLWENKHSYQRIIDKDEYFACFDIYWKWSAKYH